MGDEKSSQYASDATHCGRREELPVCLRCDTLWATRRAPSMPQMRLHMATTGAPSMLQMRLHMATTGAPSMPHSDATTYGDDGSSQYASLRCDYIWRRRELPACLIQMRLHMATTGAPSMPHSDATTYGDDGSS